MTKALVLVTGGNNGLGYYAIQQLAATGKYHLIMGSRSLEKAEAAIQKLGEDSSVKVDTADLEPLQIDVTSDESIRAAAAAVEKKHGSLDVLMLNAGIAMAQEASASGPSLRELYQAHFDTNLFGAVVTLEEFLPLLRKSTHLDGKRVAFTSSGLASLEFAAKDPEALYAAHRYPIYRSTKTAMSMIMLGYAQKLGKEGFVVSASDPGYCATNLNNHSGYKDPRDGAKELIKAAVGDKKDVHGVTVYDGGVMPW